jgi:tetratricopeptide (TPR) repeat protein
MKIDYSYIPQAFYSIKEKVYDSLTPKQKLVCAIAFVALAGLAFCIKFIRFQARDANPEPTLAELELTRVENLNRQRQLITEASSLEIDPISAKLKFEEARGYGKDAHFISAYSSFLIRQEKFLDAVLFLKRSLSENREVFYSDKQISKNYVYIVLYCQNNAERNSIEFLSQQLDTEKAHEFLIEAAQHFPVLIADLSDVLIKLNKPYDEIIANFNPILSDLLAGNLPCDRYDQIQLLSKYIDVQINFGQSLGEQHTKLRELMNGIGQPESAEEFACQGMAHHFLNNINQSKTMLQEALNRCPADRKIKKEYDHLVAFDLILEANVLSSTGILFNDPEEIAKAVEKYKEALSLFKKHLFYQKLCHVFTPK